MNAKQALSRLKSLGSAQTRKTYGRHGVTGAMFGVRYGDLAKLVREIGVDHELALALWESGNHDARVLAAKVADPEALTSKELSAWLRAVDNHVLSAELASLAARSPAGRRLMRKWMDARGEWPAATGWSTLAGVAAEAGALTRKDCRDALRRIEERIHESPNRVKYSMNTALIALGSYVPGLEEEAVAAAERIGKVEVDHGLTNCQTPLAAPYIRKAAAHHRAKLAKAADRAKGTKAGAAQKSARKAKATKPAASKPRARAR